MKKIPTLFVRDKNNRKFVTEVVSPACTWVMDGEGVATRKYDGTCVRIVHFTYDGIPLVGVQTRREVKNGRPLPKGFEVEDIDNFTGKTFGWEPYGQSGFTKFIDEALNLDEDGYADPEHFPEGTYELIGPKINGNPEGVDSHQLIRHGADIIDIKVDLTYFWIKEIMSRFRTLGYEGLVWHHPDGRMAKIKVRDFHWDD